MKEIGEVYFQQEQDKGFLKRHLPNFKSVALVIIVGVVLGSQIYNPNKRMIEAIAGLILLLILWRYSTIADLWMLLIVYPFPFSISWGTSNEIFMLIIVLMAGIRISTGEYKLTVDHKIRLPLILIAVSYLIYFKNV